MSFLVSEQTSSPNRLLPEEFLYMHISANRIVKREREGGVILLS